MNPALRGRALPVVAEHRGDDGLVTAVSQAMAEQLGLGRETVCRWVVQAELGAGSPARCDQ